MGIFQTILNSVSDLINKLPNNILPSPQQPTVVPTPVIPNVPPDPPIVASPPSNNGTFITIPDRQPGCLTGSQFAATIMNIGPGAVREGMILAEVQKGNVPDFMRNPIRVSPNIPGVDFSYYVLPDVLCIGIDEDFLRVPLTPITARKIADLFTCVLPTKKIADQIWQAADVKLSPIPGGPPYDASMRYTSKFVKHNANIEEQRAGKMGLITGHKKDVVYCEHLLMDPSRVAIYGWFYPTGVAIQGLNPTDHSRDYEDYSHGLRFVSRVMNINGQVYDFYDILKNPHLCSLISHEGPYNANRIYII